MSATRAEAALLLIEKDVLPTLRTVARTLAFASCEHDGTGMGSALLALVRDVEKCTDTLGELVGGEAA